VVDHYAKDGLPDPPDWEKTVRVQAMLIRANADPDAFRNMERQVVKLFQGLDYRISILEQKMDDAARQSCLTACDGLN
jgi:hypothetical protein